MCWIGKESQGMSRDKLCEDDIKKWPVEYIIDHHIGSQSRSHLVATLLHTSQFCFCWRWCRFEHTGNKKQTFCWTKAFWFKHKSWLSSIHMYFLQCLAYYQMLLVTTHLVINGKASLSRLRLLPSALLARWARAESDFRVRRSSAWSTFGPKRVSHSPRCASKARIGCWDDWR